MKKRSSASLLILTIITLGFYELYWLAKTRNEMVRKYHLRVPGASWILLVKAFQIGVVLLTAYILFYAIPQNNSRTGNLTRPSAECLIDYAASRDIERAGGQPRVDSNCKNQVDAYYQKDNSVSLLAMILGLIVTSSILGWLLLSRWYIPFANAVSKITGNRLSSTAVMLSLTVLPPPLGMLAIQKGFNDSGR